MIINCLNKVITLKDGTRYEVGTYITIGAHLVKDRKGNMKSEDQYYISGFYLGCPEHGDTAYVGIRGRLKGATTEMSLVGNDKKNIVEKIKIRKWDADELRNMAGHGKKNRYVRSTDGYIWVPDFMIMDHPHQILMWASDPTYTHFKELHDGPPEPPCFPDWIAEENGYEVV